MTGPRVVVTGHRAGRAVIVADSRVAPFDLAPGAQSALLWGRDDIARFPDDGAPPPLAHFQPPPGGCRVATMVLEPGANEAYRGFVVAALGDLADPAAPGFHHTPTLDVIAVTAGELVLELDDGVETVVAAGDHVILNGVRHRWTNRSDRAAALLAVQVGAHHAGAPS